MHLAISAGKDNPIYNILQQANVSFNNLNLEAFTSPEEGFRLDAGIYNLMQDTTRIDTVSFAIRQDSLGLLYQADVIKTKFRQQAPFTAGVKGRSGIRLPMPNSYTRTAWGKPVSCSDCVPTRWKKVSTSICSRTIRFWHSVLSS